MPSFSHSCLGNVHDSYFYNVSYNIFINHIEHYPVIGGAFPPPPAVANLLSMLPPPHCFRGPFVKLDALVDLFMRLNLPEQGKIYTYVCVNRHTYRNTHAHTVNEFVYALIKSNSLKIHKREKIMC